MHGKHKTYCIQWINSRDKTHSGPKLVTQSNDYLGSFDVEAMLDSNRPAPISPESRPKTYQEALALSERMNADPAFNNQSHKVIIFKRTPRNRTKSHGAATA